MIAVPCAATSSSSCGAPGKHQTMTNRVISDIITFMHCMLHGWGPGYCMIVLQVCGPNLPSTAEVPAIPAEAPHLDQLCPSNGL
jgi:hypothetical protein